MENVLEIKKQGRGVRISPVVGKYRRGTYTGFRESSLLIATTKNCFLFYKTGTVIFNATMKLLSLEVIHFFIARRAL